MHDVSWFRRFLRPGLGLAALVWSLALLGDWLHPVVVRHVICLEHGDLLDAPEPVEHAHDTTVDNDPGGDHDPCEVDGSPPVEPHRYATKLRWAALGAAQPEGHAAPAHSPLSVLSSAPKTSPPRG